MENWLKASGVTGLENVALADFPLTGRGVKALRPFKKGERVLTVPGDVLWTAEHAHDDPLLGPALRSVKPRLSIEDTLATYLLFVRSREEGYDGLRSHVTMLPTSYSSSIFFTEDELEVCAGSSLYTVTKQLHQQIEDNHRALAMGLLARYPDMFPLEKFTIEDYKWALCTVWSRSMDFVLPDGKSTRLLAPFADMLNHSSEVQQCHVYDVSSGNLSVLAGKDYEVGDQIFIHYGPIPNNRLLRLYGFVIPNNPHDSYDLVLSTHPEAPLFEQKENLWASAGLSSTSTMSLTLADPLPKDVLRYLRIQRLSELDLGDAARQKSVAETMINESNEMQILQALVESFHALLGGFATPLEQLDQQLKEGVYTPGGNTWAAAHVSLGEQRVLRAAKETAEDLLAKVGNGHGSGGAAKCANCGQYSGQLMLCGRCKGVRYCGRACQVAHFKVHKEACRAAASKR